MSQLIPAAERVSAPSIHPTARDLPLLNGKNDLSGLHESELLRQARDW